MRRLGCGCILALVTAVVLAVGIEFGGLGLLIGALPGDLRSSLSQAMIEFNTSNGYYDLKAPAGRVAATLPPIEPGHPPVLLPITSAMIAEVPADTGVLVAANALAFDGAFEPWTITCGPSGEALKPCNIGPNAILTGYFIGIERDPNGRLLFGVEVPYLSEPRDLSARSGSSTTPEAKSTAITEPNAPTVEHAVGGVVVWLRPFEGPNPTYWPFTTTVAAGAGGFKFAGLTGGESTGTGTKGLIAYLRVGDPIRATIQFGWSGTCSASEFVAGIRDYVSYYHYAASVQEACSEYAEILDANLSTARRLVADAGTRVPLSDQIVKQRYTLVPAIIDFLPLAPG